MTGLALALVLGSAVIHASWNLIAKQAKGGVGFLWLFAVMTAVIYLPVAATYYLIARPTFTLTHLLFAVVSAVIHVGYFVFLQRGYRVGDLSLVYPLARGSGPALATVLAILVLGERPSVIALCGTALVVLSVFVLTGGKSLSGPGSRPALLYGLLTGGFISIYTVWDGYAVGHLGAAPLLFTYTGELFRALILMPIAFSRREEVARAWREHKWHAFGVATLSPLAYIMVLTAMQFTLVSQVAPAREVSILIGAVLGTRLLAERGGRRRLIGAAGMVAGVVLLALG